MYSYISQWIRIKLAGSQSIDPSLQAYSSALQVSPMNVGKKSGTFTKVNDQTDLCNRVMFYMKLHPKWSFLFLISFETILIGPHIHTPTKFKTNWTGIHRRDRTSGLGNPNTFSSEMVWHFKFSTNRLVERPQARSSQQIHENFQFPTGAPVFSFPSASLGFVTEEPKVD